MHASVLDYVGVRATPSKFVTDASAFEPGPHTAVAGETDTREDMLGTCVDTVFDRNAVASGSALAVITVAQAPATSRAENGDDYGCPAGGLDPRIAGSDRRHTLVTHACASGGLGLALAAAMVSSGAVPQVLVVGAMTPRFIESAAFSSAGALTAKSYCRPFDSAADGTALGGFAGAFLIGRSDDARPRITGVGIRTLGSGAQSDVGSQSACMAAAMDQAGVVPDLVSAHATGTTHGDRVELDAIEATISSRNPAARTSSCKGELGHSVHAAGLASTVFALESLRRRTIFGTRHLLDPISSTTGTAVPEGEVIDAPHARTALVNSFGFGGSSCSIVIENR